MKFTILGCGSSMGVPRADGFFGHCNPNNKKNYRTRCSAILQSKNLNILIDTSPDLRYQLIKNKIKKIDKVLYSHMHADQTHGINDLRIFYLLNKKPIDVFADKNTKRYLMDSFSYCFKKNNQEYPAILNLNLVKKNFIFKKDDETISFRSIKVKHGKVESICYIINRKLAYISDLSEISNKDFKFFKNLDYLIIDALRYKKHPSHLNLDQTLEFIKLFKPKNSILTNLHSDLDYDFLIKILPNNVIPAYDGLSIKL